MNHIQKSNIQKINALVVALNRRQDADRYYVVGSVAKGSMTPGDLDLFVDLRDEAYSAERVREFRFLLEMARRQYGLFDPFLWFEDRLIVRNDHATAWQKASNSPSLRLDFLNDKVPLVQVVERVALVRESQSLAP